LSIFHKKFAGVLFFSAFLGSKGSGDPCRCVGVSNSFSPESAPMKKIGGDRPTDGARPCLLGLS
jgi:hypothetical protein